LQRGPGRNKLVQRRKELVAAIQAKLLPIQKAMYTKTVNNLLKTEGLLGDIEGYVIKAGDLMFKVNSPHFMSAKFAKEDDEEIGGEPIVNARHVLDNQVMNRRSFTNPGYGNADWGRLTPGVDTNTF